MIKFMVKDLNLSLLTEQLLAAGLGEYSLLIAGFKRIRKQKYQPLASRQIISRATGSGGKEIVDEANPGELRFKYDPPLISSQEVTLDGVLAAHVATDSSSEQTNAQKDADDALVLADNYRNWDALTLVQKDASNRIATRLTARRENRQLDI